MSEKFTVEILSPDRSIFKSEAKEVTIPSFEGQLGILKDHVPLITFLRPGIVIIKENKEEKFFVEEGTVEFSNNNLLILTSKATTIDSMDKISVNELLEKSQNEINKDEISDKEKYLLTHKIETLKEMIK
tara:strand:- start:1249 stop:1638 length:390 start_codon:yes stop_codon:yes gene_type:complete